MEAKSNENPTWEETRIRDLFAAVAEACFEFPFPGASRASFSIDDGADHLHTMTITIEKHAITYEADWPPISRKEGRP